MDYVLVDTPPMLPVSDAAVISRHVDATLIVVRLGRINRSSLRELARELDGSVAPRLGFIITGANPRDFYGTYGSIPYPKPGRPRDDDRPSPAPVAVHPAQNVVGAAQEGGARRWG